MAGFEVAGDFGSTVWLTMLGCFILQEKLHCKLLSLLLAS